MQGERVLVTGGAGFIGSNLAEALAEENDVVILDDLSTGKLDNIKNMKKKRTPEQAFWRRLQPEAVFGIGNRLFGL